MVYITEPHTQINCPVTPKNQHVSTNTHNHKQDAWRPTVRIEPSPTVGDWDMQSSEDEWDAEVEAFIPKVLGV